MNSVFDPERKVWKGAQVPWPFPKDTFINKIILDGLNKTPNRLVQISDDDGSKMTCEDLKLKIIRIAQNLKKAGVKNEDVVGVICSNTNELMGFVNGIIQLGAIINPMSVEHSTEDLIQMFRQTKPMLVICDSDIYEKIRDVLSVLENDAPIYTTLNKLDGVRFAHDLFNSTGNEENYQPSDFKDGSNKIMGILTSSGSSGPAKGVCMSQTFFFKFYAMAPKEEGRTLSFSPIFWGSAFGSMLMAAVTNETRIVTRKPFSPETFIDISNRHKVTHFLMNPPMLTLLLHSPLIETIDKSAIQMIMSLGGIVSEQMRFCFKKIFPKTFLMICYSLTETSVALTFPGQPIDGLTVGFVAPNHEVKIVDDDEKPLEAGEIGEIFAKFCITPFLVRIKFLI